MGNDLLIGGLGSDRFSFNSKLEGIDSLADFSPPDDVITVSAAGFGGGLTPYSFVTNAQFYQGSAAHDSSDRFISLLTVRVRQLKYKLLLLILN